ncbi:SH3 domain-containing protein [Streptomyces liangshanensis]|uniref:SH3 domain-containing protein n=1 Tax=Streptomyces liangshanensis TaxID=2717324 RepID=A0A6G9H7X5_9ACTN|nr:SH3 domain-containing protein [Streptomyces liangshanensis]
MKRRITAALAVAILAGSGAMVATPAAATGTTTPPEATTAVAALPKGKVVSRLPLSIRERPTTNSRYLGSFQPGTIITLYCKTRGQNVDGNNLWYLLGGSKPGWVSARYVQNLSPVSYCRF